MPRRSLSGDPDVEAGRRQERAFRTRCEAAAADHVDRQDELDLKLRKQIGWYCPGNKRFCYADEKDHRKDGHDFTVPVFVEEQGAKG